MNNLVGYGDDSDSDGEAPPPIAASSKAAAVSADTPASAPLNPAASVPAQTPSKPSTPTSTLTSPRRSLAPVSGSSLGIKRGASPLLSNRASPSASLHRSAVAGSSRLRRASPSPSDDASTPRDGEGVGVDSPYSIRYNATQPTTPVLGSGEEVSEEKKLEAWLRLLAPAPRINQDGTQDAEWGLPAQERTGDVDAALEAKLQKFHLLKAQGTHFNTSLLRNRQLRNPRIYEQLVRWVDVDECGSCFPERAPGAWVASAEQRRRMLREGGAERLADLQKAQQAEREAQQSSGKSRAIDFTSASSSSAAAPSNGAPASTSTASSSNAKDAAALAMARAAAVRDKLMKGEKDRGTGHERERERDRDRDRDRERDGERHRGERYREKDRPRERERDRNAGWR